MEKYKEEGMNISERYREREGSLITLALEGNFDVIAHGCNCQCIMGAGIAPQMAKAFGCNKYYKEGDSYIGNIDKLGTIDYAYTYLKGEESKVEYPNPYTYTVPKINNVLEADGWKKLSIVNAYTQFDITGRKIGKRDLDYEALTLCMRKINHIFAGKHIGLPMIGSHLAGGDWNIIKKIIQDELKNCLVTVVIYKPN